MLILVNFVHDIICRNIYSISIYAQGWEIEELARLGQRYPVFCPGLIDPIRSRLGHRIRANTDRQNHVVVSTDCSIGPIPLHRRGKPGLRDRIKNDAWIDGPSQRRRLDELVEWLLKCGVKTVAMESTSVYWIPLFQKLEAAGLEVILVNARHVRHVPGRKSDCKDCQWLQRLHSYGLLNGSFRPSDDICCLRSLMRHRDNLTKACGQQVQQMQQALNQMNIHLHHVVSDLNGETGLHILDAILRGERDPKELAKLRDPQITRSTVEAMEAALKGDWREEHLFVLRQSLENYRHLLKQMEVCDGVLEKALAKVVVNRATVVEAARPKNPPAAEPKSKKKKRFNKLKAGTGLKRDLSAELTRVCGVDLTRIIGLNVLGVLILISEIGVDMSRWRSAKTFCA